MLNTRPLNTTKTKIEASSKRSIYYYNIHFILFVYLFVFKNIIDNIMSDY